MGSIRSLVGLIGLTFILCGQPTAGFGQSFNLDARRIGMGGSGNNDNIAAKVIQENQPYRVIPIPLGLIQVIKNTKYFNPDDPEFDPARAIEFAGNPLHFTLDRNESTAGHRFVNNLVNAEFNRDLNTYRGFTPSPEIKAGGLFTPSWGKAFRVSGEADTGNSHGIYVGAGPYISMGTTLSLDPNLIAILSSSTDVYRPNTTFLSTDVTTGQAALAITGGYRGRFEVSGLSSSSTTSNRQTGLHIAADYSYLHGIHYEDGDLQFRFDTDSTGQVTLAPTTTPVSMNRVTGKSGSGMTIDLAAALVTEKWELSFGVDGVGNRINWKELSSRQYELQSLFDGGDFVTVAGTPPSSPRQVKLPVRFATSGSYYTDKWSAAAEVGRDLQKRMDLNAGAEYWFGRLAVRGGTRYTRKQWHGATGVGFNVTRRFGIDFAVFQSSVNIEETRRPSFAISLRLNRAES
jgi:hypothetical protein